MLRTHIAGKEVQHTHFAAVHRGGGVKCRAMSLTITTRCRGEWCLTEALGRWRLLDAVIYAQEVPDAVQNVVVVLLRFLN